MKTYIDGLWYLKITILKTQGKNLKQIQHNIIFIMKCFIAKIIVI